MRPRIPYAPKVLMRTLCGNLRRAPYAEPYAGPHAEPYADLIRKVMGSLNWGNLMRALSGALCRPCAGLMRLFCGHVANLCEYGLQVDWSIPEPHAEPYAEP